MKTQRDRQNMSPPLMAKPATASPIFASTTSSLILLPNLRQCLFFLAPSLYKRASSERLDDNQDGQDNRDIQTTSTSFYGAKMVLDRRRGGKVESELMMALRLVEEDSDKNSQLGEDDLISEQQQRQQLGDTRDCSNERLTGYAKRETEASSSIRVDQNNNTIASTRPTCSNQENNSQDNDKDQGRQQPKDKHKTDTDCARGTSEKSVPEQKESSRTATDGQLLSYNELTSATKFESGTMDAQVGDQFKQIGQYLRKISDEFERSRSRH